MAWLRGKVALGSFPDLAGAVNKISESVKNIEKNFDNALGFEDQQQQQQPASTLDDASQSSSALESGRQRDGNGKELVSKKLKYSKKLESLEKHDSIEKHGESSGKQDDSLKKHEYSSKHDQYSSTKHESSEKYEISKQKEGTDADDSTKEHFPPNNETSVESLKPEEHQDHLVEKSNAILEEVDTTAKKSGDVNTIIGDQGVNSAVKSIDTNIATSYETTAINMVDNHIGVEANLEAKPNANIVEKSEFLIAQHNGNSEIGSVNNSTSIEEGLENIVGQVTTTTPELKEVHTVPNLQKSDHELNIQEKVAVGLEESYDGREAIKSERQGLQSYKVGVSVNVEESQTPLLKSSDNASEMVPDIVLKNEKENVKAHYVNQHAGDDQAEEKGQNASSGSNLSDKADSAIELETLKKEMKKMEAALLGAARQARAKADEIAKLMNENEQLKSIIVDQKRKSNEAEIECLREEYHQKISTMERKVYTLTRERDTLRKEQNRRSDAAALLKEKDEIITQVMTEGEALSKKQAIQESTIRKLRAQVRDFEDEKKGLKSKIQIEENKVDNLKKDKAAIEKLMQETIEKNQAELVNQKEYYVNALSAANEEKELAKAQANDEARTEQEIHLREAKERETMLLETLEELRQTLSRKEQQAFFKEDMLRKDMDDLQKRYQASERRCEELVMQVPESTRPLLKQIETMQEATARKVEAWAAVERSLNIRLQDAEAKAKAAEERDRSVNNRLSKTLSRVNVLEAQISCLRAEQAQLTKSLEKERQRASENRQEYLALKEEADTNKVHANQLKEEMTELRRKHKRELQEVLTQRELLQQDIESERSAHLELEKAAPLQVSTVPGQNSIAKTKSVPENGLNRRPLSASSLSSMEESSFLQASLDSSHTLSDRSPREPAINSYYLKSMTPSAFQYALRQKEGELASYMSRLASLESIRDSLSDELVKMTKECDKLRSEVALLPSIKAELEALRVRHSAALELMGEQDEELEELRADNVDLKEMYREQVNLLVNKIEKGSSTEVT